MQLTAKVTYIKSKRHSVACLTVGKASSSDSTALVYGGIRYLGEELKDLNERIRSLNSLELWLDDKSIREGL